MPVHARRVSVQQIFSGTMPSPIVTRTLSSSARSGSVAGARSAASSSKQIRVATELHTAAVTASASVVRLAHGIGRNDHGNRRASHQRGFLGQPAPQRPRREVVVRAHPPTLVPLLQCARRGTLSGRASDPANKTSCTSPSVIGLGYGSFVEASAARIAARRDPHKQSESSDSIRPDPDPTHSRPLSPLAQPTGTSFSRARAMNGSSEREPVASAAAVAFSSASSAAATLPDPSPARSASARTR